jgi:hypothetical protein
MKSSFSLREAGCDGGVTDAGGSPREHRQWRLDLANRRLAARQQRRAAAGFRRHGLPDVFSSST